MKDRQAPAGAWLRQLGSLGTWYSMALRPVLDICMELISLLISHLPLLTFACSSHCWLNGVCWHYHAPVSLCELQPPSLLIYVLLFTWLLLGYFYLLGCTCLFGCVCPRCKALLAERRLLAPSSQAQDGLWVSPNLCLLQRAPLTLPLRRCKALLAERRLLVPVCSPGARRSWQSRRLLVLLASGPTGQSPPPLIIVIARLFILVAQVQGSAGRAETPGA